MSTFQILHISDLHITEKESFDTNVVLDPLIDRIKKDQKSGLKPEIVVVSGDIANTGVMAEYELAKKFFDKVLGCLKIGPEGLFIVPGNHDVNRKAYRPKDIPAYETMKELNHELENYLDDLLKGMDDYFSFVESNYSHLKSTKDRLVPFVCDYEAECGKRIGLVGLNSAWMCRKSPDKEEIAIGEYQIKNAMEELCQKGDMNLQISIFHHPMHWLWPKDCKICRKYLNESILLCGHLHDTMGEYREDLEGFIYQFIAGGAYLSSDSKWPNRFQYITVDWDKVGVRLDYRKFDEDSRKWCPESKKGDDSKKFFDLVKPAKREDKPEIERPLERPETYFEWVTDNYGHMDADKLYGKGDAFPLSLPEIFIPLYTNEPGKKTDKDPGFEERQRPVDVEALIAKNDYLLIEGHAGSGKTTLLKHLAYCLAQKKRENIHIKGMEGFLPILVILKDLNGFFSGLTKNSDTSSDAEAILTWYLRAKMGSVLNIETVKKFVKAKQAAFLLDGLDELQPKYRDGVVNAFSDLRVKNKGIKVVFTGRPHGMEGAAVKRLGDRQIYIHTLNMDQVNEFIRKWFAYLYPGSTGIGRKNAEAMIGEIKDHPGIAQLIDNPLMLTAICILYHDGKELPGQRAELYKKFIDNLLYRRFVDPEIAHDCLKTLAFRMHEKGVRSVDRDFVTGVLSSVYKQRQNETEKDHKKLIDRQFDDMEPKCGMLKFENGQYSFWHLTFQEFLAADYIADNFSDHVRAIERFWDDDWYKEVIELYIGYLSIEHKQTANEIVGSALDAKDKAPFSRWRLASRSILDIHKNRRSEDVEQKARKRMLEILEAVKKPEILADAGETLGWLGDTRDLKAFVKVEGGEYKLEKIGKVTIKPFEIGKYTVTNSWFQEFMAASGYENRDYWSLEGRKWLEQSKVKQPRSWDDRKWKCPNSPVVGVTWYEAHAFTRWLTLERKDGYEYSLLTENQWQAAAAGFAGRKYPWGNEWDKNKCNNREIKIEKTSTVGLFKQGNTPEGVSDLSGNVWEWTLSDYHSGNELNDFTFDAEFQKLLDERKYGEYISKRDEKSRQLPVLRGGSWDLVAEDCRLPLCGSLLRQPGLQALHYRFSLRQDLNFALLIFYPLSPEAKRA